MFELLLLFTAGFFGGVLNSIAGGGSFLTFPALLFAGVPPVSANATNTFSSCAGYLSGAYAFKDDLKKQSEKVPKLIIVSLTGGVLGSWLLLQTPEELFRESIPWLLLFATFFFTFGGYINQTIRRLTSNHQHASSIGSYLLLLLLFGVCTYGGFFNAGLGIIILSYLALAGFTDINTMNGIKLLVSSVVSIIAPTVFIYHGAIAWYEGIIVLIGTLFGGFVAAHASRKISQLYVRVFVILASIAITVYFFIDTYAS